MLKSAELGGGDAHGDAADKIGVDTLEFARDMPLLSVLAFQQSALPRPAEDIVAGLLQQVRGME